LNNLIVIGIILASLLLASPFFLKTQELYGKEMHDEGYDDGREDRIDGRSYNDYCSPSLNDDLGCAAYKVGYSLGWNAAGALYGGQDNSRNYEGYYADEEYYDEDEDEDEDEDDN
jgi:hypothetical protein